MPQERCRNDKFLSQTPFRRGKCQYEHPYDLPWNVKGNRTIGDLMTPNANDDACMKSRVTFNNANLLGSITARMPDQPGQWLGRVRV